MKSISREAEERAGRCAPGKAVDMWTMRLRRTGLLRGQLTALGGRELPTASAFAHMTTASSELDQSLTAAIRCS